MVLAEALYLFGVPFILNNAAENGSINSILKSRTGLVFKTEMLSFKAYPDFSF